MNLSIIEQLELQDWAIDNHFLGPTESDQLRSLAEKLHASGQFRGAQIGQGHQRHNAPQTRNDEICWVDPGLITQQKSAFEKIETLMKLLNQRFFLGLNSSEFHFALYQPGSFYSAHYDRASTSLGNGERVISLAIYLNENWNRDEGGAFCIHDPQDPQKILHQIEPIEGRAVIFLSDRVLHSVSACQKNRWSLTGWFRRDPLLTNSMKL